MATDTGDARVLVERTADHGIVSHPKRAVALEAFCLRRYAGSRLESGAGKALSMHRALPLAVLRSMAGPTPTRLGSAIARGRCLGEVIKGGAAGQEATARNNQVFQKNTHWYRLAGQVFSAQLHGPKGMQ
jgi:hypothetical protein